MRELRDLTLTTFVVDEAPDAARAVAGEIAALVAAVPQIALGLATGHTPIETYAQLVELHREGIDFSRVQTFNLDEYDGLSNDHVASFRAFMRRHLFLPAGFDLERTHFPDRRSPGEAPDLAAARFEGAIAAAGGIELQLLGLGGNGHVAFNEPGSTHDSRTRLVELAPLTRRVNSVDFPDPAEIPSHAMTMGIGTILEARRLRVLAFGAHKAEIVARVLNDDVSPALPASFLRGHPDVELWLDEAAAGRL